jgi:AcrR family transcriptional regulator
MATKSTKSPIDKRTRLVDTAAKLVHEQGFNRTTLADISRESGVPLGNVYYYFRTKEAIGEALIDKLAEVQASGREAWEVSPDPRRRLEAFIQEWMGNRESLARFGCPMGVHDDVTVQYPTQAAQRRTSKVATDVIEGDVDDEQVEAGHERGQ